MQTSPFQSWRDGTSTTVSIRLSPRYLAHGVVVTIVFLVALFTGPKQAEVSSGGAPWTFDPFSRASHAGADDDLLHGHAELNAPVRTRTATYAVQPGDVLSVIAASYGVSTESLLWANNLADADFIQPGDRLRIPPESGVLYTIQSGDTLSKIAETYGVDQSAIEQHPFNITSESNLLIVGKELFLPGGTKPIKAVELPVATPPPPTASARTIPAPVPAPQPVPVAVPAPAVRGSYAWPAAGSISQGYSGGHQAYDIAAPYGSPVYASANGVVRTAAPGWNGGYGNLVEIDHGGGTITRYAHFSSITVSEGAAVSRGQVIGYVGTTGITTGPHVHFEVLNGSTKVNPAGYLR